MKRTREEIETELKITAKALASLIQEYMQCEGVLKTWVSKILDLNIQALKGLLSFLESQKTSETQQEEKKAQRGKEQKSQSEDKAESADPKK
ncbi:MAG: hypothetical protein KDD52_08100 [Bdellovibrionales bacterium]|nr:hypothetical protein [Bdellovibrionales bacterium]